MRLNFIPGSWYQPEWYNSGTVWCSTCGVTTTDSSVVPVRYGKEDDGHKQRYDNNIDRLSRGFDTTVVRGSLPRASVNLHEQSLRISVVVGR